MPAGDPASIFRPDTRPAWIEAAHVAAFFLVSYLQTCTHIQVINCNAIWNATVITDKFLTSIELPHLKSYLLGNPKIRLVSLVEAE